MAKILFMCHSITITHVIRPLLIAKEMKKRGHQVFFGLTNEKYVGFLEKEEIPYFLLHEIGGEKAWEIVKNLRYDESEIQKELEKNLNSDLELFDKIEPDLVVNDMRWTVKMACYLKSIPYVSVANAYFTGKLASKHRFPEILFMSKVIPGFLQKLVFPAFYNILGKKMGEPMRKIAEKNNIPGINSVFDSLISNKLNLIADIPEFFPCKNLKNSDYYVGPFLWEPDLETPEWYDKISNAVYFTIGTSGSFNNFEVIVKKLSSKYDLIVSTGTDKSFPDLEKYAYIEKFLPALKILDKISLVVSHGGNGTIYQALSKGVPVIGMPSFFDQEWNSDRLEKLGLGKKISIRNFKTDNLIKAIEQINSSDKIKSNCKKFSKIISKYKSPEISANLIEGLIKNGRD